MPRQTVASCKLISCALRSLVLLLSFSITEPAIAKANAWKELSPGIHYRDIGLNAMAPWAHIHVFRINLKNNQFDLVTARDMKKISAPVSEFAHQNHALIAINGGFFDKDYRPLGLRVGHSHQHNPLKAISWWDILSITNQQPSIAGPSTFKPSTPVEFAVQSGPRLLADGVIPSLKPGFAERTALGINKIGEMIVLVTENTPLTTSELAQRMKSPPLACRQALNLDGGSSTQIFAEIGSFKLNTHGLSEVSDAIIIKPLQDDSH